VLESLFVPSALKRRASLGSLVSQSTALLMVTIGSLIMVLALLILFHQNANATKGYMLRTLERERSKLLLEEEVLKMQIAESQALERLNQDSVVQVMAPAIKLLYTNADTTMARSSLEQ
jgi:hypothetical protein